MEEDLMVTHPAHYAKEGCMEVWDIIPKALEGYVSGTAWLLGSAMKYVFRYPHKNGVQDLKKASQFLNKILDDMYDNSYRSEKYIPSLADVTAWVNGWICEDHGPVVESIHSAILFKILRIKDSEDLADTIDLIEILIAYYEECEEEAKHGI